MTLPYLRKSGSYRYVSPQNISQISEESHRSINGLSGFEDWTENPRVGGSIPPLATIQNKALGKNDTDVECPIFVRHSVIVLERIKATDHSRATSDLSSTAGKSPASGRSNDRCPAVCFRR